MITQLLNSVFAKYRDLRVSRRSITGFSLRLRQIIDLLATDKSRYFAQPRPIIVNWFEACVVISCAEWKQEMKFCKVSGNRVLLASFSSAM